MVPGHPPCALRSLIFLRRFIILRPIVFLSQIPVGFFDSQLAFVSRIILCAVVKVRFRVLSNPENDTGSKQRSPFGFPSLNSIPRRCASLFAVLDSFLQVVSDLTDLGLKLRYFYLRLLLRKEVIQPHLPIRLPCYDFTPVIGLALDG